MLPLHTMLPTLVAFLLVISLYREVSGSPPGPAVICATPNTNCTVTNYLGSFPDRSICRVASVVRPTTEAELLAAVSNAVIKKQHMKAVTVYSHSLPRLSCPGGPPGAGLAISTELLNKVVNVDLSSNQMTFGAGITLRELLDAAAEKGLALPYSPYWEGVTLGGLLATGSHGSSFFGKGSGVHEKVMGVRIVVPSAYIINGYRAKVVDLVEGDEDLLAAKVSLGVLGVISEVTLQLEPMFKRSTTNRAQTDIGFEREILAFAAATEFGDVTWYPAQEKVVYRDDVRLPISAPGSGKNDFTGFRLLPSLLTVATRAAEDLQEATGNSVGKCLLSQLQVRALEETGSGLRNNNGAVLEFTGYPVIGNQSDMQSSGSCLRSLEDGLLTVCAWDPRVDGLFYHQTTISMLTLAEKTSPETMPSRRCCRELEANLHSIPLADIASFIADVKKLRVLRPSALCGVELYYGFLMRFVRGSTAYLGKTSDSVDIDITYYRSRQPGTPRLDEDVLEEIEQMALFKYKGMPHWGKNRNVAFLTMRGKLGVKGDKFVSAMAKYDKEGLFSSDWTDAVLGLRGKSPVNAEKGCALEGLCICSLDSHCAPERGYYCKPGLVFAQARVCRKAGE